MACCSWRCSVSRFAHTQAESIEMKVVDTCDVADGSVRQPMREQRTCCGRSFGAAPFPVLLGWLASFLLPFSQTPQRIAVQHCKGLSTIRSSPTLEYHSISIDSGPIPGAGRRRHDCSATCTTGSRPVPPPPTTDRRRLLHRHATADT